MAFHIGQTKEGPTWKDVLLAFPVTSTAHTVTAWGKNQKGVEGTTAAAAWPWFPLQSMV